jgi:hypothetical protein
VNSSWFFFKTLFPDSFTVEQAVNALGFGKFQIRLSLITGLCWMSDSMEMMVLSILAPALRCEWGLSEWRQAFMTTVRHLQQPQI